MNTIAKLRSVSSGGTRWKSRYEINVYSEYKDECITRNFPCMSHLAFHVEGDELNCLATYRNHDLIDRSYGNWLGLAELQHYVAATSGFVPGELAVLAGHAFIDHPAAVIAEATARTRLPRGRARTDPSGPRTDLTSPPGPSTRYATSDVAEAIQRRARLPLRFRAASAPRSSSSGSKVPTPARPFPVWSPMLEPFEHAPADVGVKRTVCSDDA